MSSATQESQYLVLGIVDQLSPILIAVNPSKSGTSLKNGGGSKSASSNFMILAYIFSINNGGDRAR
jgi:hypothetical protein